MNSCMATKCNDLFDCVYEQVDKKQNVSERATPELGLAGGRHLSDVDHKTLSAEPLSAPSAALMISASVAPDPEAPPAALAVSVSSGHLEVGVPGIGSVSVVPDSENH